ncbi:PREDICTED: uncharacterized protein LOC109214008 [Nicotiana attenuata]|uniref:uncharacterized protein LOC109214008 n=1 Tax=Nicotiana attenuata TaxID=49451 RepID=UPI000904C450|nr:PREDICTED: uncharacterized protein LOC109214008 [Nicotiana attenuata]
MATSQDNLEKGKGILDPPIICETAASYQACMTTSSPNLDKGKGTLDPPIIRETGSTSGTSNLRHVTLNTVPIKAHRRAKKVCLVTKEQRSEYVALKRSQIVNFVMQRSLNMNLQDFAVTMVQ